jgi:transglutaminase-like putative cysteine protease
VLLEITHRTSYHYDGQVFLQPHTLRLRPTSDVSQRLHDFALTIEPAPSGRTDNQDLEGNDTILVWFHDRTDHLVIEARSTVETLRTNPFDFLWTVEPILPLAYPESLGALLAPYLTSLLEPGVQALAGEVARETDNDARAFLARLTQRLHASCRQIRRDQGEPWPGAETLARGEGSCRDVAVLMIEACRAQGLASRFVSGYHSVPGEYGHDLHAWTEVYLPGGGWRGFDPTTGFAVSDSYVALARSATPGGAAPVSGSFLGSRQTPPQSEVSIVRRDQA